MLSSRQNLLPTTNMEFSAGWKPVPSVSESNPGRSLGTITMKRRAVWKTVPPHKRSIRVNPINPCSKKTRRLNEHGFIGFNGFYKWWSAVWKTVPSVSESNPGRSLGIYNHGENCCLEDSTSHRAKHPRQSDKSVFEKKL